MDMTKVLIGLAVLIFGSLFFMVGDVIIRDNRMKNQCIDSGGSLARGQVLCSEFVFSRGGDTEYRLCINEREELLVGDGNTGWITKTQACTGDFEKRWYQ